MELESDFKMWRAKRLFRICDRFQQRGDHLVQFGDIADWLTNAKLELSRSAILQRFIFSAKNGGFGWRRRKFTDRFGNRYEVGRRPAVARLIDLDSYGSFAPGCYVLRPSALTVETIPQLMRAPRSVWVEWLQTQEWPVPPELGSSIVIEADFAEVPDRRLTVVGQTKDELEKAYAEHVKAWVEKHNGRHPTRQETYDYFNRTVTYGRIEELRRNDPPKVGRPPKPA
jgi:hypothetical protein